MNRYNMKRSEATEQMRVIDWCRWHENRYPALKMIYHVPNGGSRNKLEAQNLKAEGVKAGVPDLHLPVPAAGYHGLYVEMKWGKNKTTDNQDWWLEELARQGYKTEVCYSAEAALIEITKYLGIWEELRDKEPILQEE